MTHEPSAQRCGRVAARLAKVVERALTELDLSLAQYRLLGNLSDGPSQASTLAERLIVSRPSVTALADGLVERGLVTRQGVEGDRRRVMHVLTPAGKVMLGDADRAIEARLENLASEIGEPDRRRAYKGLDAWGRALDAFRARTVRGVS
ncbi:MAG TPA: MarR family transcriptional regulator [Actinomycetota bacterium]|nr:MarR family transcriptional regulator [Actinomycetota bacterium]